MSRPPDNIISLNDTLSLCEYTSGGHKGFWLYDQTRGMNPAMRAESEREAFVEALTFYQERLGEVETSYNALRVKVDVFVAQFTEEE